MATHVYKITNVPVLYMALGLNDFDGGKYITIVSLEGVGPCNGFARIKIITSRAIKQQVH
jgi:hypothetical protein